VHWKVTHCHAQGTRHLTHGYGVGTNDDNFFDEFAVDDLDAAFEDSPTKPDAAASADGAGGTDARAALRTS
jgi:hypothetical protein